MRTDRHFTTRAAITLLAMMLAMTTVVKAQTPYAIYCADNTTFYFTYRNDVLTESGNFTPEGTNDALTITALWSGTDVTASGDEPGWYNNSTVKDGTKTVVFEPSFAPVRPASMARWFCEFTALEEVLGTDNLDTSEATNMSFMFYFCSKLSTLDVSGFKTGKVTDMSFMFQNCSSLTSLDLSGFDTGNVKSMESMFSGCSGLKTLDVSGFDTGKVESMESMFSGCSSLTTLDVSGFDTGKVIGMSDMFSGCSGLTSLDVSGFDTKDVTNMSFMFSGCSGLTSLDVSGFDTRNVTDMSAMFHACFVLTTLDVSGFDTGNVENMGIMFGGCSSLTTLDLSGFDTGKVENMGSMFLSCIKLVGIYIGDGWNTDNVHESDFMFDGCVSIVGEDETTYDMNYTDNAKAHAGVGGYMRKTFPELTLYDDRDNTDIIAGATPGMVYQVTIAGRTIYADGCWNTICLPFNVSLNTGALTGFRARTLESAAIEDNTLTLTFGKEVTFLQAGTPYIIRSTDAYNDVSNPIFKAPSFTTTPNELTFADGAVSFIGNYDPVSISSGGDNTILYLGDENTLYYPNEAMPINAFRAYFKLKNGLTAGDPASGIKDFVVNIGDGETSIQEIVNSKSSNGKSDEWYDLSGRKLEGKPTQRGIYINNDKKTFIK